MYIHRARFISSDFLNPTNKKSRVAINFLSLFFILLMMGCQHQSKIQPSSGHIKNNEEVISEVLLPIEVPKPNKPFINLPIPKYKLKEPTYSVVVNDVPVKEILFALARDSKLNVDISPSISGNVTLNAVNQTLPAILERLSRQVNLIYRVENSVLVIEPDNPILRNYKINYVNMERDTKGGISVTNQLASAPSSSRSNTGSNTSSGLNNSTTSVLSISNNHFWDTLIKNIEDILQETDKQILINRLDSDTRLQAEYDGEGKGVGALSVGGSKEKTAPNGAASSTTNGATSDGPQKVLASVSEGSEKSLKSYKTLFASKIIANRETGILSIRATQKQHEKITDFIELVQSSAKRQVLIEASIVEIALNDEFQAGIDWSRLGKNGTLDGFTFQQSLLGTSLSTGPSVAIGYNQSSNLGELAASIKMLQAFGTSKVLSSPKLMVLNSQTAILKVVDNLVYFTITADTVAATGNNPAITTFTTPPHTIPIGIWMSVTPQINENDTVTINVRPTIARKVGAIQDPNPSLNNKDVKIESSIPQIQVREMESMLQVGSGNTVILGGLMQDDSSKIENGIPGLLSLPKLGNLFKAKSDINKKTELVIFLRPTVIKNASLNSEALEMFKQYLPENQLRKVISEAAEQALE
jgi:general secretion pathway protein D